MNNDSDKQGFKVADKRRFDSDGNETVADEVAKVSDSSKRENSKEPNVPGRDLDFSSFVMSLATQAVVQLGEMPAPAGVQIDVDVAAAKQTIDILSMLQEKTKGNLEPSEASLIEEILHTLRMSYVKHA